MEIAIELGFLIYANLFENFEVLHLAQDVDICVYEKEIPLPLGIISWIVSITYDTMLLCLALFKAAEYWRISAGFKGFHLVRALVEDQAFYYGFVIFVCVLQIVSRDLHDVAPFIATFLSLAGKPTLLPIIGSHILISMKEAGERGANKGTSLQLSDMSDIVIAEDAPTELPKDEGITLT
ncbi:uncharacterized protein FOMMEDRAFT_159430 [Fomitiporia mediterranea MF3/22]|uniref:uncharacterized protein n=1 Tax=Fomitiporia mediterranea (strain MF3/22) TaxID=694068 RepID=UPI0004407391|nr:uncharacterized protein FOMMEDRAFT_159430 [Fomitiporia mediterranea MF3/22]EJD00664.1 hypothetical protein FOMMEDRAFT_159430 [Fomitiporia mediterranea MF3/22]